MNDVKKTIKWADFTINPVKGLCPMECSYCYARAIYKRFKIKPEIRFDLDVFQPLIKAKPSRVFVGSTMELFGGWVRRDWMQDIICMCNVFKQHTFIFLTKQPQNLIKWSPFPDNCWVGVSATDEVSYAWNVTHLIGVEAKIKFISFEPLLGRIDTMLLRNTLPSVDWVIIGQQTPINNKTVPRIEWIADILEACYKLKIPVFLKDNLYNIIPEQDSLFNKAPHILRQEFPLVKGGK